MGVYLIPLDLKYEAILCLFLLESSVQIGPVEEPDVGMLGVDGRLARLGLGKLRAFQAVGCLGGCWTTRSNQFLIQIKQQEGAPLASLELIRPCPPPSLDLWQSLWNQPLTADQ